MMSSRSSALRVRIYNIDHTLAEPGPFDNSDLYRVPVLRIYGTSSTGEKACVHVHQVYPYFFVEYTGEIDPTSVHSYITRLTQSLNHALAVSFKRNPTSANSHYVRAILLVKGVHFYGFHSSYTPFLKVYVADPGCVRRAVTLLQTAVVMKTRFCVYESHISYILQFMCDFSLYGCGWIDLGEVWKRGEDEDQQLSEEQSIKSSFKASPHHSQSRMKLEVDTVAYQILNRHLLTARDLHHKLTIPAPPTPSEPLVLSLRELWQDERQRRQAKGLDPSPEIPVDLSEKSRGSGGEWVAEARWWDEIRKRIESERGKEEKPPEKGWEKWVPTTFESIDGLWEDEFKTWKPAADSDDSFSDTDSNPFSTPGSQSKPQDDVIRSNVDVDERLLSSQAITQLVRKEEAEWETITAGDIVLDEDVGEEEEDASDNGDDTSVTGDVSEPDRPTNLEETPKASKSSLKRAAPSQEDWTNISGYMSPTSRNLPITPTKSAYKFRSTPFGTSRHTSTIKKPKHIAPLILPNSPAYHFILDAAKQSLTSPRPVVDPDTTQDVFDSGKNPFIVTTAQFVDHGASRPTKRQKVGFRDSVHFTSSPPLGSWRSSSFARIARSVMVVSPSPTRIHSKTGPRGYVYSHIPPSASELISTLDDFGIPSKIYKDPHYSNEFDAPEHPKEYAGLIYYIRGGSGLSTLKDWDDGSGAIQEKGSHFKIKQETMAISGWEYASVPPSVREVKRWLKTDVISQETSKKRRNAPSQIEGPTQHDIYGLKTSPAEPSNRTREKQNMTILSVEVFAPSRPGLMPDPGIDELSVVFYSFQGADIVPTHDSPETYQTGMLVIENQQLNPLRLRDLKLEVVPSELELLNRIIDIVVELDPDIITGWEIQSSSWGYLDGRAKQYGYDIGQLISRAPGKGRSVGSDQYSATHTTTFKVIGRHVLNVWRIMRVEQSLENYTFENTAFHLLRQRVPKYTSDTLTTWYQSPHPNLTARALKNMRDRTTMVLQMLDASETVTKTAEFARVFGVDFYSVISRGSQFKVESFMFRIAKPESFVLLSPSKQDVGKQNAAECMPLIMEPQSDFYNGPLVVLDFQSLYPSIMIAYNYCYSTCVGRVVDFKGQSKFGVTNLQQPAGLLSTLKDHINVAPNGIMYVKPEVRKGLLGRMLKELLDTRVMVKQAMKGAKNDRALHRVLNARQLGLKFISNVTYGYTSATFSGRMPAVEIADSIVQSGRETLEKAIDVIESTKKWDAKVVYGDTDSLFIYLRGKTKEQAFRIGYNISEAITAMNPAPIKLKFEKVYLPCVLLAKKRYVGFKYENPDDKEPVFDAKGIETVRRDGILAQRKMTETCLKILFRTQDLSEVKEYCYRSWSKILANKAPIQDFIFAKEVKLGTYSDKGAPPPGAMVAARMKTTDANSEPQYADRVSYVIIRGAPNSRLVDRAVAPNELFDDSHKTLDAVYYITRVLIPPLERIFNLVGVDIRAWYDEMPRTFRADEAERGSTPFSPRKPRAESLGPQNDIPTIENHFRSSQCLICSSTTYDGVCGTCRADPARTLAALFSRMRRIEHRLQDTHSICTSCTGSTSTETVECISLDCAWLFARKKVEGKTEFVSYLLELIGEIDTVIADEDIIQIL